MRRLDQILIATSRARRSVRYPDYYSREVHLSPRRRYTSEAPSSQQKSTPTEPKPLSPHVAFYISFGKPIASVLAITAATYVGLYFLKGKLQEAEDNIEGVSKGTSL
ncbi:hypothetical protein POJ06DRAFT_248187 [Lipomyces tetrasporus]|uniref:Uncharacterized protein n=1 Tax=Lipomyces tetrasporus TaxID=54092 RepID=A0AAD7QVE5_9ASCO|nr:uncharacterized protein POJ06DRAFT_248187 [Lipomyces tetrasporus]KAJ8101896.1 hypothetical protein POJ06DRAFT_248187 [Lipomyces tetrasporus]